MATLSEAQAAQIERLTLDYKAQQNRDAAKIAALIALYYRLRVDPENPQSIDRWLELMIPRLIRASDTGAERARLYYDTIRRLEVGIAGGYKATAATGMVGDGVRKSLLTVGPYDFMNKMKEINSLDASPTQVKALIAEAKSVTTKKVAAATLRHAQAGGRQTTWENAQKDDVALGWVRVTQAKPCAFCAMLASRGLHYRAFSEGSFESSNAQFTGEGDAKVHDNCGCSIKPVWTKNDPLVSRTSQFGDMWSMWGAGGGDAALRFRRGYDHWVKTGEFWTWEQADAA